MQQCNSCIKRTMHTSGSVALDRECVTLLPRVCELLAASVSCLPDDTSLEKLLDWFTQLSGAGTSLHESFPCLLEFIPAVTRNAAADPAIICFMIKLTGLMGATLEGFQILQERSTLDEVFGVKRWQETGLWEDPSVRSGWIYGLRSMMQHPRALSLLMQSDLVEHLLRLQTDSSLFVASSANQLLAHVLLFYQPDSPATNGTDRQRGEAREVAEQSAYNAAVRALCDYFKDSLPPNGRKDLQQSARLLRLVAQILSRAGAPLRGELFGAVGGPLEELVTAANGQLTLPLMEVILAANGNSSEVDRRASGLLRAMLEASAPTERIRAAAAVLRQGFCDPVHTPTAVKILLLPLDIVTGQSVLYSDTAGGVQEELRNKTLCTSIVCMCVANLHQITLLPEDFLPCPPPQIVSTVVSLLRMAIGGPAASPGCAEVNRCIFGNGKIQKSALDALDAVSHCAGACDKVTEVFSVVLLCLHHPDSEPVALHKCFRALLRWTSVCADLSPVSEQLRRDLERAVQKRACDLRWEVRDSTVEFLGQQAALTPSSTAPAQNLRLLEERSTLPLLREALQDQESYVRASAVSALAQTLQSGWRRGADVSSEQADIVTQLLNILREDTEGFSRRAVVRYFISWLSSSSSSSSSLLMSSIPSVLSRGSSDLDWEVKVHTLELAKLLTDSALAGQTQPSAVEDSLRGLVERGVVSVLLSGLFDCDRPVGLRACQSLLNLRETLAESERGVESGLPSRGWGQEVRALVGSSDGAESVDVRQVLRRLDLERRLDVLSRSSDHVQNSPLSLLQDIVTAREVHSHSGTAEGQEVIVDCY